MPAHLREAARLGSGARREEGETVGSLLMASPVFGSMAAWHAGHDTSWHLCAHGSIVSLQACERLKETGRKGRTSLSREK